MNIIYDTSSVFFLPSSYDFFALTATVTLWPVRLPSPPFAKLPLSLETLKLAWPLDESLNAAANIAAVGHKSSPPEQELWQAWTHVHHPRFTPHIPARLLQSGSSPPGRLQIGYWSFNHKMNHTSPTMFRHYIYSSEAGIMVDMQPGWIIVYKPWKKKYLCWRGSK